MYKSSSRQLGCINPSLCWDCQLPVCMHPSLKDITLFKTSLSLMRTVNVCVCGVCAQSPTGIINVSSDLIEPLLSASPPCSSQTTVKGRGGGNKKTPHQKKVAVWSEEKTVICSHKAIKNSAKREGRSLEQSHERVWQLNAAAALEHITRLDVTWMMKLSFKLPSHSKQRKRSRSRM